MILIVIASVLAEYVGGKAYQNSYTAQLAVSVSVSIIFSVELLFRIAAHTAKERSLSKEWTSVFGTRFGTSICCASFWN